MIYGMDNMKYMTAIKVYTALTEGGIDLKHPAPILRKVLGSVIAINELFDKETKPLVLDDWDTVYKALNVCTVPTIPQVPETFPVGSASGVALLHTRMHAASLFYQAYERIQRAYTRAIPKVSIALFEEPITLQLCLELSNLIYSGGPPQFKVLYLLVLAHSHDPMPQVFHTLPITFGPKGESWNQLVNIEEANTNIPFCMV